MAGGSVPNSCPKCGGSEFDKETDILCSTWSRGLVCARRRPTHRLASARVAYMPNTVQRGRFCMMTYRVVGYVSGRLNPVNSTFFRLLIFWGYFFGFGGSE